MSKKKKHTYLPKQSIQHKTLKGVLEITRSGIGYVVIANGNGDVLVRQGDFNIALHGDTVAVKVIKENLNSGRKEGKIIEVIARKQTEFVGNIQLSTNFAFFVPSTEKPMPDIFIPLSKLNGAKHKDKVVVKLLKWESDKKKPEGEVLNIINQEDENDAAMKEILAESGFPLAFSRDVIAEVAAINELILNSEINKRKDFRDTLTFTIDPADAKDFDDAISIKQLNSDWYQIGIHIADVSHYVVPNTKLDEEGFARATSVYLPDRVNPMLPEKISNELCSLRPNETKLTFSAVFEMNKKGTIKNYWIGKTLIHSNHRFTYEEAQQIIETKQGLYLQEILFLHELTQHLRKERFKNGAINFSSQEVRFKLDAKGKPIGIVIKESKEANQLIEELMLLANKTVAEFIFNTKVHKETIPFPYRVHDQPDEDKLKPFIVFAKKYGHRFNTSSAAKIAESFNQLLLDAKGKPEQQVLEQLGIRTMAKAVYTSNNIGHYGLAFEHYCHFTSPIRRYPDVLVHRILESVLLNKTIIDKKMEEKCKHCSERERAAMDSERAGNKYKQVEFLKQYIGETFEGVISGVTSFGFFVETILHKCEGLVSIVGLSDYDDFRLVESDYCLVGKRSGKTFKMGDKILIRVVAANLDKRQLDFEWVLNSNKAEAEYSEKIIKKNKPVKHTAKKRK